MDTAFENISLQLPQGDMFYFEQLARKKGWAFKTKESILQKFIDTRPKNVDISDDDIMEEIYAIRYAK